MIEIQHSAVQTTLVAAATLPDSTDDNQPVVFTADAILAYCEARLNELDSQITGLMGTQNATIADQNAVGEALKGFAQFSGVGITKQGDLDTVAADIQSAIAQAQNPGVISQLENLAASFKATAADGDVDAGEVSAFSTTLNTMSTSLGSDAQMNMINIQSTMSQRETAIQLSTSLLSSYSDSSKAIAQNVGH